MATEKRLLKELKEITENPPAGCSAGKKKNDLLNAYLEVEYYDSSITTQHLFKAILYDKRQNPQNEIINSLSQDINYYQDDIKGYLYMANFYFDNNRF